MEREKKAGKKGKQRAERLSQAESRFGCLLWSEEEDAKLCSAGGGTQAGKDNPQGMDVAGDIGVDDLNQVSQVSVQS